jgi:hypothetical protein
VVCPQKALQIIQRITKLPYENFELLQKYKKGELGTDHGFLVSAPLWQKTVTGNRGLSSPIPRLLPAQENPPTLPPCPDALAFFPPRITFGEKWRNGDRPRFTAQDSLARSIAKNRKPWSVPISPDSAARLLLAQMERDPLLHHSTGLSV